jgi:aryl-alcohol dehydrogenase
MNTRSKNGMFARAVVQMKSDSGIVFSDIKLEMPRINEVCVKIVASGVCHTDTAYRYGMKYYPIILGHEGSGIIIYVGGNVKKVVPGDHVLLSYTYCGECGSCKANKTYECSSMMDNFNGLREDGTSPVSLEGKKVACLLRQGSFSTYCVCNEKAVIKVKETLDLRLLSPMGCGFQTGAGSVLNYLKPKKGSSLVVFGSGSVGLAGVMAAKIAGCSVIISVDCVSMKINLAKEVGATHGIDSSGHSADEIIKIINDISGGGVDYAFDTTGDCVLLSVLKVVLKSNGCGCGVGGAGITLNKKEKKEGKTWANIDAGCAVPYQFIPLMIDYYEKGMFPVEKLITHFPFDKINDAIKAADEGRVIKPILLM